MALGLRPVGYSGVIQERLQLSHDVAPTAEIP
jgi:hypothetical protein